LAPDFDADAGVGFSAGLDADLAAGFDVDDLFDVVVRFAIRVVCRRASTKNGRAWM